MKDRVLEQNDLGITMCLLSLDPEASNEAPVSFIAYLENVLLIAFDHNGFLKKHRSTVVLYYCAVESPTNSSNNLSVMLHVSDPTTLRKFCHDVCSCT